MLRQRLQLALIHIAVTITLVPIQSTLNRVMIHDLLVPATIFALLAAFPYLFSPIQVAIGSFSDKHPILGLRRTPYILIGLVLCVLSVSLAPRAALLFATDWWQGFFACLFVFALWGMGFNFSTVSYFSLASELSGEKDRSRTISVMFVLMVVGIIVTSSLVGGLLKDYVVTESSPEVLYRAFEMVGLLALTLGGLGVIKLEPRFKPTAATSARRENWRDLVHMLTLNRQTLLFFIYLVLMLAAILGQDNLLEPFAAQAFDLSVGETTMLVRILNVGMLVCMILAAWLERRIPKQQIIVVGSVGAMLGFIIIIGGGVLANQTVFYTGVAILGLAIGLATVSNLSLMLDMTRAGQMGLFIGAWGMASAFARLSGDLIGGIVRDLVSSAAHDKLLGYLVVFGLEAGMLLLSLIILRAIDVKSFQTDAEPTAPIERMAMASE